MNHHATARSPYPALFFALVWLFIATKTVVTGEGINRRFGRPPITKKDNPKYYWLCIVVFYLTGLFGLGLFIHLFSWPTH